MDSARGQLLSATEQVAGITPSVIALLTVAKISPKDFARQLVNHEANASYMGILVAEVMRVNAEEAKKAEATK